MHLLMEIKMNERIKRLSIEAGFPEWSNHAIEFELEKFAELIVRECIVDFYRRYLDITSNEDITVQVERYIEQNFGVEG